MENENRQVGRLGVVGISTNEQPSPNAFFVESAFYLFGRGIHLHLEPRFRLLLLQRIWLRKKLFQLAKLTISAINVRNSIRTSIQKEVKNFFWEICAFHRYRSAFEPNTKKMNTLHPQYNRLRGVSTYPWLVLLLRFLLGIKGLYFYEQGCSDISWK